MTASLDTRYPKLSELVQADLKIDLEQLASRAPAFGYELFDLERLLALIRAIESARYDEVGAAIAAAPDDQVRGYMATLEAFVALVPMQNARAFLRKKLHTPTVARPAAKSSEMLDTLTECCWGLWFYDQYGNIEAEKRFPANDGDADFFVDTPTGPLWIDCISPAPKDRPSSITRFLVDTVVPKWKKKFGARPSAAVLPSAIAVTSLMGQEHLMPMLVFDEITQRSYIPPDELWAQCPSLQYVWFGVQSWSRDAQRPNVITTWKRP